MKHLLFILLFGICACVSKKQLFIWETENELKKITISIAESDRISCFFSYDYLTQKALMECRNNITSANCQQQIFRYNREVFVELARQVIEKRKRVYDCYSLHNTHNLFISLEANNKIYEFEITRISSHEIKKYKALNKIDVIFAIIYLKMDSYKCFTPTVPSLPTEK